MSEPEQVNHDVYVYNDADDKAGVMMCATQPPVPWVPAHFWG
jgi:hypothetical protein